jgi:hypothetical protein
MLGPHVVPLTGDNYEFYSYKKLTDYSNVVFDKLSFVALAAIDPDQPDVSPYPSNWKASTRLEGLSLPCLREDLFKTFKADYPIEYDCAVLLSWSFFHGVVEKVEVVEPAPPRCSRRACPPAPSRPSRRPAAPPAAL